MLPTEPPSHSPSPSLGTHQGHAYHAVSLHAHAPAALVPWVSALAALEARCWNPREPFDRYLSRATHVVYTVPVGGSAPSAFAVFTVRRDDDRASVSLDEAMVSPEFRQRGLATRLTWCAARAITSALARDGRTRTVLASTVSANPVALEAIWKMRAVLPSHSFAPDDAMTAAGLRYVEHHGLTMLRAGQPWWLREVFPGAHRRPPPEALAMPFPSEFDPARGDAMLVMGAFSLVAARTLAHAGHARLFGLRTLASATAVTLRP